MVIETNLKFNGPAPNGGEQKGIDAIVLHHRAGYGTVESLHEMHLKKGWWGIAYHYYIRRDGSIYRGRPEKFDGSHAGSGNDYNTHSIGICFEGNMETDFLTAEQIASGRWLIADIKSRYAIKQVIGHKEISPTACPGKNFDIKALIVRYTVCIGEFDNQKDAETIVQLLKGAYVTEV